MTYKITALTNWIVVDGVNTPNIIPLADGESRTDITGQQAVPTDPNIVVWEIYTEDLPRYEADANIYILSSEVVPDEISQ